MGRGFPSMTALLGLLAVAGSQLSCGHANDQPLFKKIVIAGLDPAIHG